MLAKILVYFLCISLLAFIYVYKIPIFCTECQKPTGMAASFFRCIIDEDKLCNVHNELVGVKERTLSFFVWIKDIITKDIPDSIFNELQRIFKFFKGIEEIIKNIIGKIKDVFMIIKTEVVDKITKIFTDLTTNLTDMLTHIGDGVKNFASLIYQSIDNIRNNAIIKINEVVTFIQTKIKTEIIDVINNKVIKPVKGAFEEIATFFGKLIDKIISPFKDFFDKIAGLCVPEVQILGETVIFNEISVLGVTIPGVKIPRLAVPGFCPFSTLNDVYTTLKTAITDAFNEIVKPVTDAIDTITTAFGELETLITKGIETVKTSIKEKFDEVKNYIIGAFDPIKTFFKNLGNDISTKVNDAYTFIKEKLSEISDKITSSITSAFDIMWKEIKEIFKPVIDFLESVWDSFMQVYKNFIKGLNDVYIEVKKQWDIVYNFVKERIFYVLYIYWINFIDRVFILIPMSKVMKVNIVNGLLVMGLLGVGISYYNVVAYAVASVINGALTVLGDSYSIIAMIFPYIQSVTDIVYSILTNLPTLTFAMDTLSFLSPATIIPNILNQLIDLAEMFVGGARDIVLTPYFLVIFICTLIVSIVVGIHKYMYGGTSLIATLVEKLPQLPAKVKIDRINTDNIHAKNNEIKKENVIDPIKVEDMSGVMGIFQDKIKKFKRRVDLIEEVRKEFEMDPNNPGKYLEMNLDTMRKKLDEKIANEGV